MSNTQIDPEEFSDEVPYEGEPDYSGPQHGANGEQDLIEAGVEDA